MQTQYNQESFEFHSLNQRQVTGRFDGGSITSDAGGLLLREVEKRTGIIERFAACFRDHRDPLRVDHTAKELVAQRVYALALGYEDLNDHDQLRQDPLLAMLADKPDQAEVHAPPVRSACESVAESAQTRSSSRRASVTAKMHFSVEADDPKPIS